MAKINLRGYEIAQVAISKLELLPIFAMRELKGEDVDSLAESIKAQGLINPLLVRVRKAGGGYELISGHRRYLALKQLKADTAPAHVIDATDEQAFVLALTENIERRDPTPIEDAQAFKRAMDDMKMKPEAIAKQVGRSPSWVLRRVQLLELEPRVQAAVQEGTVSSTMAEEAFLKLKHHGDQLELLKDVQGDIRNGSIPTAKNVEQSANQLIHKRAQIEALAKHLQGLGDQLKYPKCPKCGRPPTAEGYGMDLKRNKVQCSSCYNRWDLIKGEVRDRETTLDGQVSSRSSTPGGENVVKVEASGHRSLLTIMQFFNKIAELVTKSKAVTKIRVEQEYGEGLKIRVHVTRKELQNMPLMTVEEKNYKGSEHKTHIDVGIGNWGGGNKETLQCRDQLWALEKLVDSKIEPAKIIRVPLERVVIDHVALSKGKELLTREGTWTIQAVHRDYTAIVTPAPAGADKLIEEDELRALVKSAKKFGAKAGKKSAAKKLKGPTHAQGACAVCGCTEDNPCEPPCSWANETRTLCSACAHKCKEKKRSKANGTTYCGLDEAGSYCIDDDLEESSAFECPKGFKRGEKPKKGG